MISKKLSEMEEQQLHSNDERGRLRTENAVLTERIHVLEEQLLLVEQRSREQLQEEKNRTRELFQRMEREKQLETESLTLKYQNKKNEGKNYSMRQLYSIYELKNSYEVALSREQLQEEKNRTRELFQRMEREKQLETESLTLKYQYQKRKKDATIQMLEKDLQAAKKETEKAREETARARDTVEDLQGQLAESKLLVEDLEEERVKLERQFRRFKEEAQHDIDSSSEMVEVLTQQTEELKRNGPPRQGSIIEQMNGLEESLEQARSVIRDLQYERDELQAQLLATSVERGRSLLADQPSLADELMTGGGDSQQVSRNHNRPADGTPEQPRRTLTTWNHLLHRPRRRHQLQRLQ
ncbi:hypothetical protein DICVIV_02513 [Dictyocaulus viviparus]|uniref:Rab11-FIP3/4 domain-containing protein n=1 Tax=Dictyocaulus viviparus TaxID=29172 RepID=A0A0D8Y3M8_DICVI|nr:hypothetical protein DICVIV_02513 [Dictyocaulus viviparus]